MRKRFSLWFLLSLFCLPLLGQDRSSTANENVFIPEQTFEIPGLKRSRKIRLYLPPGYENTSERYPVVYMHDGQNLFDDTTSFLGEWGVDELMNELAKTDDIKAIVVGIDNGGNDRIRELNAWDHPKYGKAEGKEYMEFVVRVIKPYIDANYRTRPDRKNTLIMGSSLGGLISHYAIYQHPGVFGKVGIFSPSYWIADGVFEFTKSKPIPSDARLYLLVGGKEGDTMAPDMVRMSKYIITQGHPRTHIKWKVNPEGEHNEKFWHSEFKEAMMWLFSK